MNENRSGQRLAGAILLDGWHAMLMIAHLICKPTEEQERRDKEEDGENMPEKKCGFQYETMLRAPYGAETDEAECRERRGNWPTVCTKRSAKTNAEKISENPRK